MSTSFKIEHNFPKISVEKFEAHLNDPRLNEMLAQAFSFEERKLLNKQVVQENEIIEWKFLVRKKGELPGPIKKILKGDVFSWQETMRLVKSEHCLYWHIEPELKTIKFYGEGVCRLKKAGEGTKRIIEGNINVDIPLVGKIAEAFIVNELKSNYDKEPKIQEQFYSQV